MLRIIAAIVIPAILLGETQKEVKKRGKEFAKSQLERVEKTFENYDKELFPLKTEFDASQAKNAVEFGDVLETEALQLTREGAKNVSNSSLHQDDSIFAISDKLAENQTLVDEGEWEMSEGFTYEKCHQSGSPYQMSYIRTLDVKISDGTTQNKVCSGHRKEKKFFWKKDAYKEAEKQEKKLSSDKSIQSFIVKVKDGDTFNSYKVIINFTHIDDTSSCDAFKIVKQKSGEEVDVWTNGNESRSVQSRTPDCTFTHAKCLDSSPSIIDDIKVKRKCWMEELFFICKSTEKDTCGFLKDRKCTQLEKKCLKGSDTDCALWELTFKCGGKFRFKPSDAEGIFDEDESLEVESGGQSFPEVYTKLKVFNEMNKEIKSNPRIVDGSLQVFNGMQRKCSKSISSDLMYDCCLLMRGLATDLKLTKCNADELDLAEMRERGFCHYIGKYDEQFLDLWKSRDNHVFCCFSTKLYKVVHEGVREQIGLGWGTPEHPICRGLTIDEISKADFSKLDLSEAFSDLNNNNEENAKRLDTFTNRLKESLEKEAV